MLTSRQREIMDFIAYCIRRDNLAPTLREIGAHLDIGSANGVNDHLRYIEKKGYIKKKGAKSRGIILTDKAKSEYKLRFAPDNVADVVSTISDILNFVDNFPKSLDFAGAARIGCSREAQVGANIIVERVADMVHSRLKSSGD